MTFFNKISIIISLLVCAFFRSAHLQTSSVGPDDVTGTTHNHDHHTHDHTHDHSDHTHDPDHGSGEHEDGDHSGHSMQMFFYASSHATILFEGWHTMEYWQLFLSCLAIMLLAILYEGFKEFRQSLLMKNVRVAAAEAKENQSRTSYKSTDGLPMTSSTEKIVEEGSDPNIAARSTSSMTPSTSTMSQMMASSHLLQALLHVLQLFFSYCLMLIFMTYNAYLCIALCLGGGIGYWMFAWKRFDVTDKNEHCN